MAPLCTARPTQRSAASRVSFEVVDEEEDGGSQPYQETLGGAPLYSPPDETERRVPRLFEVFDVEDDSGPQPYQETLGGALLTRPDSPDSDDSDQTLRGTTRDMNTNDSDSSSSDEVEIITSADKGKERAEPASNTAAGFIGGAGGHVTGGADLSASDSLEALIVDRLASRLADLGVRAAPRNSLDESTTTAAQDSPLAPLTTSTDPLAETIRLPKAKPRVKLPDAWFPQAARAGASGANNYNESVSTPGASNNDEGWVSTPGSSITYKAPVSNVSGIDKYTGPAAAPGGATETTAALATAFENAAAAAGLTTSKSGPRVPAYQGATNTPARLNPLAGAFVAKGGATTTANSGTSFTP